MPAKPPVPDEAPDEQRVAPILYVNHERLVEDIVLALQVSERKNLWIDREKHAEQHEFIESLMRQRDARIARRLRLAEKISGTLIIGGILFVISVVGYAFVSWLRAVQSHPIPPVPPLGG